MTYISPDLADKIKDSAKILDVISDHVQLKKQGTAHVGDCPVCNAKKKFNISEKKSIWKCWICDISGTDAVSFLMKVKGNDYPGSLQILADRYGILIEPEKVAKSKAKRKNRTVSFRDEQLKQSGISDKYQKYWITIGDTQHERDRYQSATVDNYWEVVPDGDDMLLNYIDLESQPMTWKKPNGKARPLVRVRWANPALHLDKEGKPGKYKQPYGSGSHLWIPNQIISAYKTSKIIDTLYICEGEKKADKLCLAGMDAVGVMGIHNFAAGGEMPYHFEKIIKACAVQNVIFVLDSDWQDISTSDPKRSVGSRPNLFFKAVLKFRDYFRAFYNEGIELEIFFMYHHDTVHKGIDDLLVYALQDKEAELKEDIEKTLLDRQGKGRLVNIHKITETSSYKLKEFWNLHATPAFFRKHKEALKKLREFKFGNLQWRWNQDDKDFELAQKLMPNEKYWKEIITGYDKDERPKIKYQFSYTNILNFLRNRGFALYEYGFEQFRFVQMQGKVITETTAQKIQRYVMDFTREIDELNVLELLLRGGKQYLGPDKLSNMFLFQPEFNEAEKDAQFLYFKNYYWKITADKVIQRPLSDLPKHIWQNKIIDFEPKHLGKPMAVVGRNEDKSWGIKLDDCWKESDIAKFFMRTSDFSWKKQQRLVDNSEGMKVWAMKDNPEEVTAEDTKNTSENLICKMLASGYILHEYLDYGNMKAIVCMDGIETEVGKSQGGTGKSIFAKQFKYLVPQEVIDGKKKNIEDDNHLYEGVDERTRSILFDDVRVNFNFEFLFSQITTGVVVNPKGEKRYKVLPPKFIITTNHALNGDGNSFARRQYPIAFSDYFNKERTVGDEYGRQFFHEWEYDQWNYFYNWMATCIQAFLQHGLTLGMQTEALEKRRLRQQIGENFIDWADVMYHSKDGGFLNKNIEKVYACEKFLIQSPMDRKYINTRRFKEKLKQYARYMNLDFNVTRNGDRIRVNSKEYFLLSNTVFDANHQRNIHSDTDLTYPSNTL